MKRRKPEPLAPSSGSAALRHPPGRVLVLLVDGDGLASAEPLVVVEESAVLGAGHVVMSVGLHRGSWGKKNGGQNESFLDMRPSSQIEPFLRSMGALDRY